MAWSFRKRIKILPGVHINLSKSGVSTSIGPKGAKVTIGPKGTFLHTGIPGTGLYNRQKISPTTKGTTPPSPTKSVYSPSMNSTPEKTNNKGFLHNLLLCVVIVFCIVLAVGSVLNINDIRKNLKSLESQYTSAVTEWFKTELGEQKDDLKQDLSLYYLELALSLFVLFLCARKLIKRLASSASNDLLTSGHAESRSGIESNNLVQQLRTLISNSENPQKTLVLNNYLGHIILEDAEKRLKHLAIKYKSRFERKPTPQNEEILKLYEEQYNAAKTEAKQLIFDFESEFSELEKKNYKEFCDAFDAFRKCNKTWIIISRIRNTELKSSAYSTVDRNQISLTTGRFPYLKTSFDVPSFPSGNNKKYYYYPRFIIYGDSLDSFEVYPLDAVSFEYSDSRFIETSVLPSDAKKVDITYKYVNKNGGPDRRFADNPVLPVMLYGEISISPFGNTFQVSNNETAIELNHAFNILKDGYISLYGNEKKLIRETPKSISSVHHSAIISNPDELLVEAAWLVSTTDYVSTSELQKDLGIGFSRAGLIMDQLEAIGLVGPQFGTAPRKVLVKDNLEIHRILESINCVNNKQSIISEQFFNDVLDATKRIFGFGNILAKDDAFCKNVGDSISTKIEWNGKLLTDPKEKIPIILWADVLHCYSGLGHDIDLSSNEGLGLLIFSTLMIEPNFKFEYRFLDMTKGKLVKKLEDFTRNTFASMSGNEERFLLEACLKDYNIQLHNQYVVLLYRFASFIAKADQTISTTEANWLNTIMSLKEPEEDSGRITPFEPINQNVVKTSTKKAKSKAMKELNSLIGLASVKTEINTLANYIKVQNMRAEKGMKVSPVSYHCVFTGNPGTGKTTVARIVSEIYKELGILKKGHLVETDRSGLVAEYVGQTAVKTNKIIDSALDGILFIDEAYSLVDGGNSDYGKEAIATLLKRMEDDRDRIVVILAGYTEDMKRFIESNPGLQSRFNRYIEFPDYSAEELFQIFESNTKKYEYKLTEGATTILKDILEKAVANKDKFFGNGRFVRNLFEKVIENQANRISSVADITAESLATIEENDIIYSL